MDANEFSRMVRQRVNNVSEPFSDSKKLEITKVLKNELQSYSVTYLTSGSSPSPILVQIQEGLFAMDSADAEEVKSGMLKALNGFDNYTGQVSEYFFPKFYLEIEGLSAAFCALVNFITHCEDDGGNEIFINLFYQAFKAATMNMPFVDVFILRDPDLMADIFAHAQILSGCSFCL